MAKQYRNPDGSYVPVKKRDSVKSPNYPTMAEAALRRRKRRLAICKRTALAVALVAAPIEAYFVNHTAGALMFIGGMLWYMVLDV